MCCVLCVSTRGEGCKRGGGIYNENVCDQRVGGATCAPNFRCVWSLRVVGLKLHAVEVRPETEQVLCSFVPVLFEFSRSVC